MSYNEYETSDENGKPVSLYTFTVGEGWVRRYTSADHDITIADDKPGAGVYSSVACGDTGSAQGGGDGNSDQLSITIDSRTDIATLFDGLPPSNSVWVTKRKLHLEDEDQESIVSWIGRVGSAVWNDAASKTLSCRTLLSSLQSKGLRLCWERNCGHMLYGPGCGLDPEAFSFTPGHIDNVTPTGYFLPYPTGFGSTLSLAGGFISFTDPKGLLVRRTILSMQGPPIPTFGVTIAILGGTSGITVPPKHYFGCDHTDGDAGCTGFDNNDNFGGFKYQPGKSPFDGDPVF